ncbi:transcription cofactor vestigial-like protein 1 [Papio anubis]|uniref:Vestigial like family member 1 n=2 Tax=Cercopithecinae TaxID=9528 RepID=A0A096MZ30_PAPAN|nr:transcription cofactor vestigial-like protein 1 [Papio anubis]XP_025228232.1 transcription cofactor vestigial-like protein 1 isoform X2 [Theropithecus gelada]XP_025228233.1 transcription cofactor vestigial-like protein 1 isoform X2 [Theropithecus gelada]
MEEMKKTDIRMPKGKQKPIKTEWNSRCVLFTYFQGDISSVVDEHFSRALSNIKSPQELTPSSQSESVMLKNDDSMSPNQWRYSSPWTKPQPEVPVTNRAANCNLHVPSPMAVNQFSPSLARRASVRPGELWHFSSLAGTSSLEPGYSHAFPARHLVPEPQPDGKREPLLSLLQQDRCLARPQEPVARENGNPGQAAGSTGLLFNMPPGSVHYKKLYVSRGSASTSLPNETLSELETPGKYSLTPPNHWGHPHRYLQHL